MDSVRSISIEMNLWPVEHFCPQVFSSFCPPFFPDQCWSGKKRGTKVFNWSEVHFYRSTSFKIHTLAVRWKICPSAKINQWQTTEHNFAVLCLVEKLSKGVSFNYLILICFSKRVKFPLKNCQNSPNIFSGVRNPVPKQGKKIQFLQPIFF